MIDPADKQTQALPLDEQQAKRKRGRPATGKAMTPAEKQRAYRERQKKKAAPELGLKGALENWETACRNLGAANDRVKALEDQVQRLQAVRDELISELRATKKELESRYEKPSKGLSYRKLTEATFDQVKTNAKSADIKAARDWSFGTFLLWDYLAPLMNVQEAAYETDRAKLREMVGLGPKAPK
ncbi:hypothetical protein B6N17_001715 [Stutzerimonas stutzeri]|jgi:small-conductance mechanosensitive channel|uniref:hypothetical protein n=1 Tax=Stutzerimonas stutzeri TaxID=316 RepID=UPI000A100B1A|nr:hypothetical protein [Stutzerimonas stutzeri]OSO75006.1 hypothetical protein B6N17_001715 [Stutzerimonas stutzeri]